MRTPPSPTPVIPWSFVKTEVLDGRKADMGFNEGWQWPARALRLHLQRRTPGQVPHGYPKVVIDAYVIKEGKQGAPGWFWRPEFASRLIRTPLDLHRRPQCGEPHHVTVTVRQASSETGSPYFADPAEAFREVERLAANLVKRPDAYDSIAQATAAR